MCCKADKKKLEMMNRFYVSCIFLSLSPFLSKFFRDIFRWWNVVERRGCDPFLMVTIEGHYNTSASVLLNSSCQPHALIMMMLYYCHFAIITVKFSGRERRRWSIKAARANVLELRIIHTLLSSTKISTLWILNYNFSTPLPRYSRSKLVKLKDE